MSSQISNVILVGGRGGSYKNVYMFCSHDHWNVFESQYERKKKKKVTSGRKGVRTDRVTLLELLSCCLSQLKSNLIMQKILNRNS